MSIVLDASALLALGLSISPFTVWQAELCGRLGAATAHLGLSLGDRACLALGLDLELPVLTVDRAWSQLSIGIEVRTIRN